MTTAEPQNPRTHIVVPPCSTHGGVFVYVFRLSIRGRIALETNQLQCLRLFDHELEKLKRHGPADALLHRRDHWKKICNPWQTIHKDNAISLSSYWPSNWTLNSVLDRCKEGIQAINFEVPFLAFCSSRGLFLCVCCMCVCVCQRGEHGMSRFEIDLFLVRH